ncbi:hypothetical protein ACROYT_G042574 [Oculina patagonica]
MGYHLGALSFVVKMAAAGNGVEEYHCNYCQADCTSLRVKCAECTDFDLCLQCFACGAEMGKHKRGHDYQLMDSWTPTRLKACMSCTSCSLCKMQLISLGFSASLT